MFKMNKVYSSVRCVRAKSFRKFIRRLLSLAVVSRSGAKRGHYKVKEEAGMGEVWSVFD